MEPYYDICELEAELTKQEPGHHLSWKLKATKLFLQITHIER
jgi:hypothetical protein